MMLLDWNAAKNSLKETVPQTQFQNWFKPLEFIRSEANSLVLGVPSRFHEDWIRNHYGETLHDAIRTQVGSHIQLEFEVLAEKGSVPEEPTVVQRTVTRPTLRVVENDEVEPAILEVTPNLPSFHNPFVELEFNTVAVKCARLFQEGSEFRNSPLVILGGVGMGKTHLLSEIGTELFQRDRRLKIRYVTAEGFANEFFEALKSPNSQTISNFKRKYREDTDYLLFDNLEGLSKKIKTQEEFLHTFNEIMGRGGRVVFSTSVPPTRLEGFIDSVKSRILSGILAEIKYPCFQDKVSLLQKMCGHYAMEVDAGVLRTMANQGQKDIRELIGTLVRLHLQAKLQNTELNQSFLTREGISSDNRRETITLEEITTLVEHNYGVCRTELTSKSRRGATAWARQVAMYLARQYTLMPLEQIGKAFGRDHATVVHAFQKVTETIELLPTRRFEVEHLKHKLESRSPKHGNTP